MSVMNGRYYRQGIFLLAGIVLFAGCSRQTGIRKSRNTEEVSVVQPGKKENLSSHEISGSRQGDKSSRSWREIVADAENNGEYDRLSRNNSSAPVIDIGRFSDIETQHVKISYYDPFGEEDCLVYNLGDMQRDFYYPCDGKLISDYGMRGRSMHTGVDIKAAYGDNIYAAFDGVVRMSKLYSSYGNVIVIRHYNGLETVYAHNSKNLVKPNDVVRAGDVIAKAGRTGRATTEHLHFEVRVKGQYFDPKLLIDVYNRKLQDRYLYVYNRKGGPIYADNRLTDNIPADDKINVSEKIKAVAAAAAETAKKENKVEAVYHKIVKGDTLYALALRYKTTVSAICKLNGINSKSVLRIGQQLRIK